MILKIPVYYEITVEGDYNPNLLGPAAEEQLTRRVYEAIISGGADAFSSKNDLFDSTALKIKKQASVKNVNVVLLKKTQVFKKLSEK